MVNDFRNIFIKIFRSLIKIEMISNFFRRPVYKGLTTNIKRFFDLHEYQSKDLMRKFNIKVQRGNIATNPDMAFTVARDLDADGDLILKAQVHAGGRGKGVLSSGLKGGVQILQTPEQVREMTKQMIGYNLVTHQTPKDGLKVDAVLIHEGVDIQRQIYFAIILDRNSQGPAIVCSTEGGVEIEEVAKRNPDAVKVFPIDITRGITEDILKVIEKELKLQEVKGFRDEIKNMYQLFRECDATQLEINPWAVNPKK